MTLRWERCKFESLNGSVYLHEEETSHGTIYSVTCSAHGYYFSTKELSIAIEKYMFRVGVIRPVLYRKSL